MVHLKQSVTVTTKNGTSDPLQKAKGRKLHINSTSSLGGRQGQLCEMMITSSLKPGSFLFSADPEAPLCDFLGSRLGVLVPPYPREATI